MSIWPGSTPKPITLLFIGWRLEDCPQRHHFGFEPCPLMPPNNDRLLAVWWSNAGADETVLYDWLPEVGLRADRWNHFDHFPFDMTGRHPVYHRAFITPEHIDPILVRWASAEFVLNFQGNNPGVASF